MKKTLPIILLITMIVLSACGLKASAPMETVDYYSGNSAEGLVMEMPEAQSAPAPAADMERSSVASDAVGNQMQERMVIQNADLTIVVADPQEKMVERKNA